jgi:hypothetical protein
MSLHKPWWLPEGSNVVSEKIPKRLGYSSRCGTTSKPQIHPKTGYPPRPSVFFGERPSYFCCLRLPFRFMVVPRHGSIGWSRWCRIVVVFAFASYALLFFF